MKEEPNVKADQKRAHCFGTKLHLQMNGFAGEKKNGCPDQAEGVVSRAGKAAIRQQNASAPPRQQEQSARDQSQKVLRDRDGAKIAKPSQEQKDKPGIKKVAAIRVAKGGAGEFTQRG